MFTNQYYTSYIVAEKLFESKHHSTGTILTNRKELPNLIKKKKKKIKISKEIHDSIKTIKEINRKT